MLGHTFKECGNVIYDIKALKFDDWRLADLGSQARLGVQEEVELVMDMELDP
jgi:hypothetical protein